MYRMQGATILMLVLLGLVVTAKRCTDIHTALDAIIRTYYPESREELDSILYHNDSLDTAESGGENMPIVFETSTHDWFSIFGDKEITRINLKKFLQNSEETTYDFLGSTEGGSTQPLADDTGICDKVGLVSGGFENWSGTQTRSSIFTAKPRSLDDIKDAIACANVTGLKVRAAGSLHSWSPLFADEGQIVAFMEDMEGEYDNGEKIIIDRDYPRFRQVDVSVMAGVTVKELKEFQLKNKVNLPCNVVATEMQVVSLVATGSHGTGWTCKTPGDYVMRMRIVDSSGRLRTYSLIEDRQMMRAAQASYGLFGIIYDITLRMDYQTIVETRNEYYKVGDVFYEPEEIKRIVESSESVQMIWFPFNSLNPASNLSILDYDPKTDEIWARLISSVENTDGIDLLPDSYYILKDEADYVSNKALSEIAPVVVNNPFLTPSVQYSSFRTIKEKFPSIPVFQELPHAIHFLGHVGLTPIYDMEFAFNFEGNYSLVTSAIGVVIDKVKSLSLLGKFPLNIGLEMRWMAYSDTYLSSASVINKDYGHIFYLEVVSLARTAGWVEFCTEIAEVWRSFDGVPHLAKQWSFLPEVEEYVRKKFRPYLSKFVPQLKRSLADPDMMFFNEGLQTLFCQQKIEDNGTVAFHVRIIQNGTYVSEANVIVYRDVITNVGNGFDPVSGIFTCPVSGTYEFSWTCVAQPGGRLLTRTMHNSRKIGKCKVNARRSEMSEMDTETVVVQLEACDKVYVTSKKYSENKGMDGSFMGHLLSE